MLPSECVLERRVRADGDADLAATNLRLFILKCEDRKAGGYADEEFEIYNQRLKNMKIGVRLADAPPVVSYLVILGAPLFAEIVAVDKTVIVIRLEFAGEGGRTSYLIYDAVAFSLRLIPPPKNPRWIYTLSSHVSIVRRLGGMYALVHTGMLDGVDEFESLYLWRPSSSRPWSEKKSIFSDDFIVQDSDMEFSFHGHAYWVDLLCGVSYCSCDDLFVDNTRVAKFGGFIPLPVEEGCHHRSSERVARPDAYRTMGVVRDSFIRFISIDGFQDHVKLENRTVTVWKLLGHDQDQPWYEEHRFSLKTLWGFDGFGDMPRDLTPMYPLLSTKNADIVYLVLGEYRENPYKWKFVPSKARYLLAVDMQKKVVTSLPLADWIPDSLISCGFNWYKALVEPCNDEGIPMKKPSVVIPFCMKKPCAMMPFPVKNAPDMMRPMLEQSRWKPASQSWKNAPDMMRPMLEQSRWKPTSPCWKNAPDMMRPTLEQSRWKPTSPCWKNAPDMMRPTLEQSRWKPTLASW